MREGEDWRRVRTGGGSGWEEGEDGRRVREGEDWRRVRAESLCPGSGKTSAVVKTRCLQMS